MFKKQTKYDEMLSQLSSDVITPPPMKPKTIQNMKIYKKFGHHLDTQILILEVM